MSKQVTLVVEPSKDISYWELILEHSDSGHQRKMTTNPETFLLNDGDKYVYLLRYAGKPKSTIKITIKGAIKANTPVVGTVQAGGQPNSINDDFIA